ncbi:hypothetical protein MSAN_01604900 [Mycena sanguinolenta]|uniref:Uncharacterized protein n=1 Tax=Mycena sanguinolenta TaxID=230812 RepID=A0A8H7CXE6_9AGAR|nr:hypothetical protein MSAN_01604900 [Mycena sanguinolenta]
MAMSLAPIAHGAAIGNDTTAAAEPLAAPFGVNIGQVQATGNMVAWVAGASQCQNVIIGPIGTNFCGRAFTLNGISLSAEGCGGGIWLQQNGVAGIWAECASFSEASQCGVVTNYHCV